MIHVSAPIIWVSPLVDVAFFVALACLVAAIAKITRKLPVFGVLVFSLSFLTAYDWVTLTYSAPPNAIFLGIHPSFSPLVFSDAIVATGSINEIADDLSNRLIKLFLRDANGRRPVFGNQPVFQADPHWRDYIPFYEYFHGDSGAGLGASHQTGWTGLVAKLIQQQGERRPDDDEVTPAEIG